MKTAKCEVKKSVLSAAVFAAMAVLALAPVTQAATVTAPTPGHITTADGGGPYPPVDITASSGTTDTSDQSVSSITFNGGNVEDTYSKSGVGSGTDWIYAGQSSNAAADMEQGGTLTVQSGALNIYGIDISSAYDYIGSPALTLQNTFSVPVGIIAVLPYATNVYITGSSPILGSLIDDMSGTIGFGEFESGGTVYGADNTNGFSGTPQNTRATLGGLTLGADNYGQLDFYDYGLTTYSLTAQDSAGITVAGVGGNDGLDVPGNITVNGPATIENVASGGYMDVSANNFTANSLNLSATQGTTYFQSLSVNLGGTGTMTINPGVDAAPGLAVDGNVVNQGGNVYAGSGVNVSGDLTQISGNLYLTVTPGNTLAATNGAPIISANQYNVSGGNVFIDAYDGKDTNITSPFPGSMISSGSGSFANGDKWALIKSTGSGATNTSSPANAYIVYDGGQSSTIAGYQPYLTETSTADYLCIGSACVPAAQPAPAKTTPVIQPAPAPAKTPPVTQPAPAPAKTPPVTQPVPAPLKIIPVKVVTPVEETQQTVANTPYMTIQQARDAQNAIISTGIVGGGPRGWWAKGVGGTQSIGADHGVNYGLIAGYGWSVGPDHRDVAGVAFSAGQSGLGTGPRNFTNASDYGLWAYGTYYPNASRDWKFSGAIGGGMSTNTMNTTSLGLPQAANFGGSFMGAEVRSSYWTTLGGLTVSPRLSLGYDQSWTGGYSTHGGSFMDVNVASQSSGQLYVEPAVLIGKKFNYRTASGDHTLFPQVRVGMVENIGPTPSASVSSGQVAGQVQGLSYPHTQGMAELRLDVTSHTRYSKGLSGNISVRQLFGGGASQTEAVAAIKYRW